MIVIQLSDPHILAPGELLYGRFDTAEFLARSVAEINRLDPLPDVAVITGDLVDHGEPAEYEHLRALLSPLAMPVFVIPGNHDAREPLRTAFDADGYLPADGFLQFTIEDYPVRLVALDTLIPGEGIVSLAARARPWQPSRNDDFIKPVSWLPLPARGHRACRLALSLLQSEPA